MGCDIHLCVEVKSSNPKSKGRWRAVTPDLTFKSYEEDWDVGRNYHLFAILANVRNYGGSKGFEFNPIANPRGWPTNASGPSNQLYKRWDGDAHSASHFTLRELTEFDWEQTIALSGFVDAVDYADMQYRNSDVPIFSYSSFGNNPEVHPDRMKEFIRTDQFLMHLRKNLARWQVSLSDPKRAEMRVHDEQMVAHFLNLLNHCEPRVDRTLNGIFTDQMLKTHVQWDQTYAVSAGNFYSKLIPKLKELGKPDDVRILFFFDN